MRLKTLPSNRFLVINSFLLVCFVIITVRLLNLGIFQNDKNIEFARRQHSHVVEIPPKRGLILDRNENILATSLKTPSIYAVPRDLTREERKNLVPDLKETLDLSRPYLEDRLSRDKLFIWIKRRVTPREAEEIRELENPSVSITEEYKRFYPYATLLSNVLGFCNIDGKGIEGLEMGNEAYLKGQGGYKYTKRDARGREIPALEERVVPAINGSNVLLTVDLFIQHVLERELSAAYKKWKAKGASAVVMDPETGEILAIASYPSYDSNEPGNIDPASRRNRVITDTYEPGSVFKIVTASACLNEGLFDITDEIDCEGGEYRIASNYIHDVHEYDLLSVEDVIIYSSNIGTVKMAQELGSQKLYEYIKKFGFGEKTGIDLPGEVSGFIRHPKKWSGTSIGAIPMGQEVTVTALQMARATAVIANGGKLVKPVIVKEVRDENGVLIKKARFKWINNVISAETAETMRGIMKQVVERGTGKRARIKGVTVGGKTGTAQKVREDRKGYSHSKFMSSFIGFAPVENPKVVMAVVLDEARPRYYGGTVAAPVFAGTMSEVLPYLGVYPDAE